MDDQDLGGDGQIDAFYWLDDTTDSEHHKSKLPMRLPVDKKKTAYPTDEFEEALRSNAFEGYLLRLFQSGMTLRSNERDRKSEACLR